MKQYILTIIGVIAILTSQAQKPVIDSGVYGKWPAVNGVDLSNDGKYVVYSISNKPLGNNTLYFKALNGSWEKEVIGASFSSIKISPDSKHVFFKQSDTLCRITLGGSSLESVLNVDTYSLSSNGKWLMIQPLGNRDELIIQNVKNSKRRLLKGVKDYLLSPNDDILVYKDSISNNRKNSKALNFYNLSDGNHKKIWEGYDAVNYHFNEDGSRMAFKVLSRLHNSFINSIWSYQKGDEEAVLLADDRSPGIAKGFEIQGITKFGASHNQLFISLIKKAIESKTVIDHVKVDVWSYNDPALQSLQRVTAKNNDQQSYLAVLNLSDKKIISLEQGGDFKWGDVEGDFLLLAHQDFQVDRGESNWNSACKRTTFLVSTITGDRVEIEMPKNNLSSKLSPNGKYILFFDPNLQEYFSYKIADGKSRNISNKKPVTWRDYNDEVSGMYTGGEFLTWSSNGDAVFISDHFDIWQLDLAGTKSPVNITNGYGKSHNMSFTFAFQGKDLSIKNNERILFNVYDRTTHNNGYYEKTYGTADSPQLLTTGRYIYQVLNAGGQSPLKARSAEAYIVMRQSASESPNYFFTTNFKVFTKLSNVNPERSYNWLTTELIEWGVPGLNKSQGILYKPENFDPSKKYPVIFWYYEKNSQKLNEFFTPDYNFCNIDIPTFVSQGYLVFVPDIHYRKGEIGENALNTLVSAANILTKRQYVDGKRLGLQGHSFGGYQTNYIVTHTNVFAAAMSACGVANATSFYGFISGGGTAAQPWCEVSQGRFGFSLWEDPEAYIKNSPIFSVDKICTPVLLLANRNDPGVPFSQGIEFYIALRRLGKTAWLLQYDDGEHWVVGKKAQADFAIRVSQFFNYYLKGTPAPKWMIGGVPASKKGIDDGLALEPVGVEPRPNLLMPEEQRKVDSLQNLKAITIKIIR